MIKTPALSLINEIRGFDYNWEYVDEMYMQLLSWVAKESDNIDIYSFLGILEFLKQFKQYSKGLAGQGSMANFKDDYLKCQAEFLLNQAELLISDL